MRKLGLILAISFILMPFAVFATDTPTETQTETETATDTQTDTQTMTATPTPSYTATFTYTGTMTSTNSPTPVTLDNFEDGEFTVNNQSGAWASESEGSNTQPCPSCVFSRTIVTDSAQGTYAALLNGSVVGNTYPYIAMNTNFNAAGTVVDLNTSSTGITLTMKGTKGSGTNTSFMLRLLSTNISDGSYWNYSWTPAASYTTVSIPWTSFGAPGWGEGDGLSQTDVLAATKGIQWQIIALSASGANSTGNSWYVDNVIIYSDAPTATMTPTQSFTVTNTVPAGSTATFTPTAYPTSVLNNCSKKLLSYYTSWNSGYRANKIPFDRMTHICHAFIETTTGGALYQLTPEPALIAGAHAKGVKVMPSLGGAGTTYTTNIRTCLANTASRGVLVNNMNAFIRTYGYDGLDIDWEYPSNAAQGTSLNLFVDELRVLLPSSEGWLITMAVGTSGAYDYGYLIDSDADNTNNRVDFINVMTYDMYGSWSGVAGHNAALSGSVSMETYMTAMVAKGIPKEKLLVGMPFYGRSFNSSEGLGSNCTSDSCASAPIGSHFYNNITNYINANGWTKNWDDIARSPYLTKDSGTGVISYDDPQSIGLKSDWAINTEDFGGIFMWDLSNDYMPDTTQPLLAAMYNVISGFCEVYATPTPVVDTNYELKVKEVMGYPNPLNPAKNDLKINYSVDLPITAVNLKIFTYGLRLVRELPKVPVSVSAGKYVYTFNKAYMQEFSNGMYLYVLEVTDQNGKTGVSKIGPLIIMR